MDSVVQRLHRALAEALEQRRPDYAAAPVTVAEIYQELVPYRSVRDSIGFEMNADYEHALLRLLSGEDALVRLEPEEVREQLVRELAAPNPDVALFRRFAACDAWVTPPAPAEGADTAAAAAESAPAGGESEGPAPGGDDDWTPEWLEAAAREVMDQPGARRPWMTPDGGAVGPEGAGAVEENAEAAGEPSEPGEAPISQEWDGLPASESAGGGMASEVAASAATQCAFCGGALPSNRPVRYCPYCGVDQRLRPCARCGDTLEPGWRYCISCGAPAPTTTA